MDLTRLEFYAPEELSSILGSLMFLMIGLGDQRPANGRLRPVAAAFRARMVKVCWFKDEPKQE